jgi:hypothetical protein
MEFCVIILLLTTNTNSAIQAPFLIDGKAVDDQSITISWRNNSTETEWFIIIRTPQGATPVIVDTADKSQTIFTDRGLPPGTTFTYSLKAGTANSISVESNAIQVATLPKILRWGRPTSILTYNENDNTVKIDFYDSCNIEKGFQLFRSHNFGAFQLIGEQRDTLQLFMGWRTFSDSAVNPDEWYTYKVVVVAAEDSAASAQETLYTHKNHHGCYGLEITKLSTFSTRPAGREEIVGDSLYILESAGESGVAAAVINIVNPSMPTFMGYIYPANIPKYLDNTPIPSMFNLGGSDRWGDPKTILVTKDKCFKITNDSLLVYSHDGLQLVKNIKYPMRTYDLIGILSDTLLLVQGIQDTGVGRGNYYLCAYSFSQSELILKSMIPMGHYDDFTTYYFGGTYGNKVFFESFSSHPTNIFGGMNIFHMYDYSIDPQNPLHFTTGSRGAGQRVIDIDSCRALRFYFSSDSMLIYAYEKRNAQSSVFLDYLSVYRDTAKISRDKMGILMIPQKIIADTAHKRLIVIFPESGAIYSYKVAPADARVDSKKTRQPHPQQPVFHISPQGVASIHFDNASPWIVKIFDVKGRTISSVSGTGKKAVWRCLDGCGKRAHPSAYIARIQTRGVNYSIRIWVE